MKEEKTYEEKGKREIKVEKIKNAGKMKRLM